MTDRYALIVAPFSTGARYPAAFAAHDVQSIAITLPDAELPAIYHGRLDPAPYRWVITHHDLPTTLTALRDLSIVAVAAGTEIGVVPAALIAAALGLPGPHPDKAPALRNKAAMTAAWAAAGIDVPLTLETDSARAALRWIRHHRLHRVVVKPLDSAGSDGLRICDNAADLTDAFTTLHRIANVLGGPNERLLVQEFLQGPQYVINTVTTTTSTAGRPEHIVTERWADHRTPGRLYDRLDLLHPGTRLYDDLTAYAGPLLDALGMCAGPAHTEVVLTHRGLRPIEIGARPEGAYPVDAMRQATGSDHVADAATALITGTLRRPPSPTDHPPHVAKVSLISPTPATLHPDTLNALLHLPTVLGHHGTLTPGRHVEKTIDLPSSPGRLLLAGDPRQITADYHTIRHLEATSLYTPATHSTTCAY